MVREGLSDKRTLTKDLQKLGHESCNCLGGKPFQADLAPVYPLHFVSIVVIIYHNYFYFNHIHIGFLDWTVSCLKPETVSFSL